MALDLFFEVIAFVAILAAAAALVRARRLSRRVERLSESYWELRYEHGQLSARLARLAESARLGRLGRHVPRDLERRMAPSC